uniref:Lipocalin n=1 Tax=Rhipicephalus zambeziensis TaxID=60191 RepID=A0A224YNH5_9ACAR
MVLIFIIVSLFLVTDGQDSTTNQHNKCASGEMTGMDFFSENMTLVMLRRTYNFTADVNDSICVKAPFRSTVYENLTVARSFTYRNMSSTSFLNISNETIIQLWPITRFLLHFYTELSTTGMKYNLTYVNSTRLWSFNDYNLPNPTLRFKYCDNNCSVLEVLNEDSSFVGDKKCELWVNAPLGGKPNLSQWTDTHPCVEYFKNSCRTEYPVQVYNPVLCE